MTFPLLKNAECFYSELNHNGYMEKKIELINIFALLAKVSTIYYLN